jgi:beta-lactamase class D
MFRIRIALSTLAFSLSFSACAVLGKKNPPNPETCTRVQNQAYQVVLDSAKVSGTVLIFNPQSEQTFSNNFDYASMGFSPASTFKIPNTLIGLELGLLRSEDDVFQWDGVSRWNENWNQDLPLRDAFRFSCLPCYQQLARKIGYDNMQAWLEAFQYGNMDFDSSEIDQFWLTGKSKISCFQQIQFLQQVQEKQLPVKSESRNTLLRVMLSDSSSEFELRGKTGWCTQDSIDYLWYVGILEKGRKHYYVALQVTPKPDIEARNLATVRKEIALECFRIQGFIKE